MIGRMLGGFRIIEQIGMGGMATVFKAYDASADRYVAIKTLPQQYSSDPSFRARFELEAKSIAKLEHIHILPMFAYGEEDGIAYMAMRYLESGTLKELIAHESLSLDRISQILKQIANALDYAHSQHIIHRDIKPSNILLDHQGNIMLTDFGIAKIVESSLDLTGTGIVGTPQYMSPEQFKNSSTITAASDQYSLGVVAYEMVTGRTPYEAETPLAILQKHMVNEPLPLPHTLRPGLPQEMEDVLLKALSRDPEQRFPSCMAMADAFEEGLSATEPPPVPDVAPTLVPEKSKRLPDRKTTILKPSPKPETNYRTIAIAVIVLLLIMVGIALISSNNQANSNSLSQNVAATLEATSTSEQEASPIEAATALVEAVATTAPTETPSSTPSMTATASATSTVTPTATATMTASATATSTATATATEVPVLEVIPLLYDDFEDKQYDGALNPYLWRKDPVCKAKQEDGAMKIEQSDCHLDLGLPHVTERLGLLEADLQLPEFAGVADAETFGVQLVMTNENERWSALCGLGIREGVPRGYFSITDGMDPDYVIFDEATILKFDQQFHFQLEGDRSSSTFSCSIDGEVLASYKIDDLEAETDIMFFQRIDSESFAMVDNVLSDAVPGFGFLDVPAEGETVSGIVEVSGWTLMNHGIDHIDVVFDSDIVKQAVYGLSRTDVGDDYPEVPHADQSGFVGEVDTRKYSNGEHEIGVWITNKVGDRILLLPKPVKVTVSN